MNKPYLGLRPFNKDEYDIFFGRKNHVDTIIDKLAINHFVAIVGASGCGKSSLAKTGLLHGLESGFLQKAGPDWSVLDMRPAGAPLYALASGLVRINQDNSAENEIIEQDIAITEAILRRGPLGLVEKIKSAGLSDNQNVLILVDQFEELFRYSTLDEQGDAVAFVNLLLSAIEYEGLNLYVVITMRSDFIGDCAQIPGLAEAINDSQFLTPRLNRVEAAEAIAAPAQDAGVEVDPKLVNRILNDMGTDPDQLPIMQHLMMRIWEHGQKNTAEKITLSLEDYEAVGGFKSALNNHADEIFKKLTKFQQGLAKKIFMQLTEVDASNRHIRRPIVYSDLKKVLGEKKDEEILNVLDVFRASSVEFIFPKDSVALTKDTIIDISHESLIRQWKKLCEWTNEEAKAAENYRSLERAAIKRLEKQGSLLRNPELKEAKKWQKSFRANSAWANKYGDNHKKVLSFVKKSNFWNNFWNISSFIVIFGGMAGFIINQHNSLAKTAADQAKTAAALAKTKLAQAKTAAALAKAKRAQENAQKKEKETLKANKRAGQSEMSRLEAKNSERAALSLFDSTRKINPLQTAIMTLGFTKNYLRRENDVAEKNIVRRALWSSWSKVRVNNVITPHKGEVSCMALSSSGKVLATGGKDGKIWLYKISRFGSPIKFKEYSFPKDNISEANTRPSVYSISLSKDGQYLAAGSSDGRVWVKKISSCSKDQEICKGKIQSKKHTGNTVVKFNNGTGEETYLASGGRSGIVNLWSGQKFKFHKYIYIKKRKIYGIAFSPVPNIEIPDNERKTFFNYGQNEDENNKKKQEKFSLVIAGSALSKKGSTGLLNLYDLNGKLIRKYLGTKIGSNNHTVIFSKNGQYIFSGGTDDVFRTWSVLKKYPLDNSSYDTDIYSLALNTDGKKIFISGFSPEIIVRSPKEYKSFYKLFGHEGAVRSMLFDTLSKRLITLSDDGTIRFWNDDPLDVYQKVYQWDQVANDIFDIPKIREKRNYRFRKEIEIKNVTSLNCSVKVSKGGVVKLNSDKENIGSINLSSILKNKKIWRIPALLFSKKESLLILGLTFTNRTGAIIAIDLEGIKSCESIQDRKIKYFNTSSDVIQVKMSIDGEKIWYSAANNTFNDVLLKQFAPNKVGVAEIKESNIINKRLRGHNGNVISIAIGPKGNMIASGSTDETIHIWDAKTSEDLVRLNGHNDDVSFLGFSKNGKYLLSSTGSGIRTVKLIHYIYPDLSILHVSMCQKLKKIVQGDSGLVKDMRLEIEKACSS